MFIEHAYPMTAVYTVFPNAHGADHQDKWYSGPNTNVNTFNGIQVTQGMFSNHKLKVNNLKISGKSPKF